MSINSKSRSMYVYSKPLYMFVYTNLLVSLYLTTFGKHVVVVVHLKSWWPSKMDQFHKVKCGLSLYLFCFKDLSQKYARDTPLDIVILILWHFKEFWDVLYYTLKTRRVDDGIYTYIHIQQRMVCKTSGLHGGVQGAMILERNLPRKNEKDSSTPMRHGWH